MRKNLLHLALKMTFQPTKLNKSGQNSCNSYKKNKKIGPKTPHENPQFFITVDLGLTPPSSMEKSTLLIMFFCYGSPNHINLYHSFYKERNLISLC